MTGILCAGFLFLGCCILLAASPVSTMAVLLAIVGLICAVILLLELVRYYRANPLFRLTAPLESAAEPAKPAAPAPAETSAEEPAQIPSGQEDMPVQLDTEDSSVPSLML